VPLWSENGAWSPLEKLDVASFERLLFVREGYIEKLFSGQLAPHFALRAGDDRMLALLWIIQTDQPWASCKYAATPLLRTPAFDWICEDRERMSTNEGISWRESVARWDRIDAEGIWLQDLRQYWGPMKGWGLGLGNGHIYRGSSDASLRPGGLFNAPDSERGEACRRWRHQFFLKETI